MADATAIDVPAQAVRPAPSGLFASFAAPQYPRLWLGGWMGNLTRPMSDRQLDAKFRDQAVLALPPPQVDSLLDRCWHLDEVDDVSSVVLAAVPAAAAERVHT